MQTFEQKIQNALTFCDLSQFNLKELEIKGDESLLITPKVMGAEWNKDNLYLRSCLYRRTDFFPLSLGFPKFFNMGEKPDLYSNPADFKDWNIEEKVDGSAIFVSKYKGELIVRSRGTFDAISQLGTGEEIRGLVNSYNLEERVGDGYTFCFEYVSQNFQIILKYDKPELILLDIIRHCDYTFLRKEEVKRAANNIGLKVPKTFQFNSIEQITETCKNLEDSEGFVLSYNGNQNRVKIKSLHYLKLHRLKSELSNKNKLFDVFEALGYPEYNEFYSYVASNFDYELAEFCKVNMADLCAAKKAADALLRCLKMDAKKFNKMPRKEAAEVILNLYKKDASFVFTLMDKGELDKKQYRKFIEKFS